jgi:hypothetical protein
MAFKHLDQLATSTTALSSDKLLGIRGTGIGSEVLFEIADLPHLVTSVAGRIGNITLSASDVAGIISDVNSVNGKTGVVVLSASDIPGLNTNTTNTTNTTSITRVNAIQHQRYEFPTNVWTTLASISGEGVINKIWIALGSKVGEYDCRDVKIRCKFNDESIPQVGGTAGINLQNLFGPGFGSTYTFRIPRMGVTKNDAAAYSGFMRIPMPFSDGALVEICADTLTTTSIQNSAILMNGTSATIVTTPDGVNTSPTSDLEFIFDIELASWTTHQTIISKWIDIPDQRAFGFEIDASGKLLLFWSSTGADTLYELSTVATGFSNGTRHKIKATLDCNNGASGRTVSFYEYLSGGWTGIGSPIISAGTTVVFNSSAQTVVGAGDNGIRWFVSGTLYECTLNDTIGGVPEFTVFPASQPNGTVSWTASTGETWSIASATVNTLSAWSIIEYADAPIAVGDVTPSTEYTLHIDAVSSNVNNTAEQQILDETGNILFVGFQHRIIPIGSHTDFNYLEGDYRLYYGNEVSPSYRVSGTEDMYGSSYYFAEGLFQDPEQGIFIKNVSNGSISAYKFYYDSILPRDASRLRLTWTNGDVAYLEPGYVVTSMLTTFYYKK